jgi:hypothetical protein
LEDEKEADVDIEAETEAEAVTSLRMPILQRKRQTDGEGR